MAGKFDDSLEAIFERDARWQDGSLHGRARPMRPAQGCTNAGRAARDRMILVAAVRALMAKRKRGTHA